MQWVAEIKTGKRSRSYIYLDAETRGQASGQLDRWMRANCVDPETVVRLGWSFDSFLGSWELSQSQEITAEFYQGRPARLVTAA